MQSSMDLTMENHGHASSVAAMAEPMLGSGLHMPPYSGSTELTAATLVTRWTRPWTRIWLRAWRLFRNTICNDWLHWPRPANSNSAIAITTNATHQQLQKQRQSHLNPSNNRQSQSSPILQQQPAQPFTLADLLSGDVNATSHALNNLQALAKLGSQSKQLLHFHFMDLPLFACDNLFMTLHGS